MLSGRVSRSTSTPKTRREVRRFGSGSAARRDPKAHVTGDGVVDDEVLQRVGYRDRIGKQFS
jgi:hypothetical protein